MSERFRQQMYETLNAKETQELLSIWQGNNRAEWTGLAFEVIAEILQARLGELPAQPAPVLEIEADAAGDEEEMSVVEAADPEDGPVFYNPQEVWRLKRWINWAALAAVLLSVLSNLFYLPLMHNTVSAYLEVSVNWDWAVGLLAILFCVVAAALQCILYYFPLKALSSILKILMEMEFNSRGVK